MRPLPLVLGVATLVTFAAILGIAIYGEVAQHLPHLLLRSDSTVKVSVVLSLAVLGWAALATKRSAQTNHRLETMALLTLGLGVAITLVLLISPVPINVDETKVSPLGMLKIMAPSHSESLMPLAFGLLAATVATARASRRPAA